MLEVGGVGTLGSCADDDTEAIWLDLLRDVAEALAFVFVADLLRDPHLVFAVLHQHQVPTGQRDTSGSASSLQVNGPLGDLHHYLLALLEDFADRGEGAHLVAHLMA